MNLLPRDHRVKILNCDGKLPETWFAHTTLLETDERAVALLASGVANLLARADEIIGARVCCGSAWVSCWHKPASAVSWNACC